jgi:hypothetical protein
MAIQIIPLPELPGSQPPEDVEAAVEAAEEARKAQNENMLQQNEKKVRLVRQTSTFFKRMASRQLGVDLDEPATPRASSSGTGAGAGGTPAASGAGGAAAAGGGGGGGGSLNLELGQPTVDSSDRPSIENFGDKVFNICLENKRDAVLQPCGHGGFCYDCAKTLLSTQSKCPLCRAPIKEALRFDTLAGWTDEKTGQKVVVSAESAALPDDVGGSAQGVDVAST